VLRNKLSQREPTFNCTKHDRSVPAYVKRRGQLKNATGDVGLAAANTKLKLPSTPKELVSHREALSYGLPID
jgi:hypothetical protein